MKQFIRRMLLGILLLGFILPVLLITTEPGLFLLSRVIPVFIPGHLHIERTEGQLFNQLHLHNIDYQYNDVVLHVRDINLQWFVLNWHPLTIAIPHLEVTDFLVENSVKTPIYAIKKLDIAGELHALNLNSQLSVLWHDMSVPVNDKFDIQLPVGLINVTGPLMHYHAEAEFYSSGNHFPTSTWKTVTEGDFTKVHIQSLTGKPLDGNTKIAGDVAWLPDVKWDASIQAEKLEPSDIWSVPNGQLSLSGHSNGLITPLHSYYQFQLNQLHGNMQGQNVQGKGGVTLSDEAYQFDKLVLQFGNANLQINGTINQQQADIDWQFVIPDASIILTEATGKIQSQGKIMGSITNPHLQASMTANKFHWNTLTLGNLETHLDGYGNTQDLTQFEMTGSELNFDNKKIQQLAVQFSNQEQKNQLRLTVKNQQAQLQLGLSGLFSANAWNGQLKQFVLTLNNIGNITLLKPATVSLSRDSIAFEPFCLTAAFGSTCIQQAKLALSQTNPKAEKRLNGVLQFTSQELAFLSAFWPQAQNIKGNIEANFHIAGTTETPKVEGVATLSHGNVDIPRLGLKVTQVEARIQGNQSIIHYDAKAQFGKGQLKVNGNTNLAESGLPTTLKIQGNNLTVVNNADAVVLANPDLVCKWNVSEVNLTGKIAIPFATITPLDLSSAITLPRDVVFVTPGQQDETQKNINFYSHIQFILGDKVSVNYSGLSGNIIGAVTVEDKPGGSTTAAGVLNINQGKYKAYGQNLTIRPSKLIYTGGPVTNPGLNIEAIKQLQVITMKGAESPTITSAAYVSNEQIVGVRVTGTLNAPNSKLFSEPAGLSQSDILSYLILGRPASQATQQDSASIFQAISLLNLGTGVSSQIQNQFTNLLGLDQLTLGKEEEYNKETNSVVENTSLLLGKALSPRLYISYSLGLIQPINTIRIVYKMTKYFSLQSSHSNDANGVDVFLTIDRE